MRSVTGKIRNLRIRDLGASLVEMGLLVSLVALIAMPAVKRAGLMNTCQICKYNWCLKWSTVYPNDCNGSITDQFWWTIDCVENYQSGGYEASCGGGGWMDTGY